MTDKNNTSTILDFSSLNVNISNNVKAYPIEKQQEIFNYISEMDEIHKKAYNIAFDHLGSSFDVLRSNGYKEWKNSKKT
jgi:hypothetical protein